MTWTRHVRTDLAHSLLLGSTTSDPDPKPGDPREWSLGQEYPKPGSKLERVARIALARELRRGDEQFIKLVAAMIDPRTSNPLNPRTGKPRIYPTKLPKNSIIKQKIEFTPLDKRREPKISARRDLAIATFIHEWRVKHPRQSRESAIAEAAEHFRLDAKTIWGVWNGCKPPPEPSGHCK
jgi:hypothetical protein